MTTEIPYPEVPPQAPQPVYANHRYPVGQPNMHATRHKHRVGRKIKIAFYAAILFVILSYSGTYRLVNTAVSAITNKPFDVVSEDGSPTIKGVFLHTLLFFVIAFLLLGKM
jgi:hypothetical protein